MPTIGATNKGLTRSDNSPIDVAPAKRAANDARDFISGLWVPLLLALIMMRRPSRERMGVRFAMTHDVARYLSAEFEELMRRIAEQRRRLEELLERSRQQIRRSEEFLDLDSLRHFPRFHGSLNEKL